MTIADVYAKFQSALPKPILDDSVGGEALKTCLDGLGVSTLTITTPGPTVGLEPANESPFTGTEFTLEGTTTFLGVAKVVALLTVTAETSIDDPTFELKLTIPLPDGKPSRDLSTLFPTTTLPPSLLPPPDGGVGVTLQDSILSKLALTGKVKLTATSATPPAESAPVSFSAPLDISDGPLVEYSGYFGNDVTLEGTIDFTDANNPILNLRALSTSDSQSTLTGGSAPPITPLAPALRLLSPYQGTELDIPLSAAFAEFGIRVPVEPAQTLTLSTPIAQGGSCWSYLGTFDGDGGLPLSSAMGFVRNFFGATNASTDALSFPLPQSLFDNFALSTVGVGVTPPINGNLPSIQYLSLSLTSLETWTPTVAFVTVTGLGTSWLFRWYGDELGVSGSAWGTFSFHPDVNIQVTASFPSFLVTGMTTGSVPIHLAQVVEHMFKLHPGESGVKSDLKISQISVTALPREQTYSAVIEVESIWQTKITDTLTFSLDSITASFGVAQSNVFGTITAFATLTQDSGGVAPNDAVFSMSAGRSPLNYWVFEGGLSLGSLNLTSLVRTMLAKNEISADVPVIDLTEFWLSYDTSESNNFSVRASLQGRWTPNGLKDSDGDPVPISLVASTRIAKRTVDGKALWDGAVSGSVSISKFNLSVGMSFASTTASTTDVLYFFEFNYDKIKLRAATELALDPDPAAKSKTYKIFVASLSGLTLGNVATYFARLASPNQNYQLEAPWDFLNDIQLGEISLKVDPKRQRVSFAYKTTLNLTFFSLKSVGMSLDRSSGTLRASFEVSGSLMGQSFGEGTNAPLVWDALNESAPAVPGKGSSLFSLSYLGMGQHVAIKGIGSSSSIGSALDKLRAEMLPPESSNSGPPLSSNLFFSASSQWMLGLDFTVMGTVRIGMVFQDPDLYGLFVSVAGPSASSLAGLYLELRYNKVSNDVGVFRVRLQVPAAFRQIQLGMVALTLGEIALDIYTNGNFMVDLGFPHNGDFSRSFGADFGPFTGRGGLYFGLLDGATSSRVPAIKNGTFSPVVELGVGLSMGIGKSIQAGPLRAELSLQMVTIVQGVLAWFHPTNTAERSAMYYWAKGSAALVGKLYGSVDFKVISALVSLTASASIAITIESNRASLVELRVSVSARAQVKAWFVTVSFSFDFLLEAAFNVGSDSATPWILGTNQSGTSPESLLANVAPRWRRRPFHVREMTRRAHLLRMAKKDYPSRWLRERAIQVTKPTLAWPKTTVFPSQTTQVVAVKLLPIPTVDQVAVQWKTGDPASADQAVFNLAFLLTVDNDPGANAFTMIVEAMLRGAVAAVYPTLQNGRVTAGQLDELARQLDDPNAVFSFDILSEFLLANLLFQVSGPTISGDVVPPQTSAGVPFPMPPVLTLTSVPTTGPRVSIDFAKQSMIDDTYVQELSAIFAALNPGKSVPALSSPGSTGAQSMAQALFCDYFLLIAKAAVQAAIAKMSSFPYTLTGSPTESLSSICEVFDATLVPHVVRPFDTVDHIASVLGFSQSELLRSSPDLATTLSSTVPGTEIDIAIGVTPESLAVANGDWDLNGDVPIPIGSVFYNVGSESDANSETLATIAESFQVELLDWFAPASNVRPSILLQTNLLVVGEIITVPAGTFSPPDSVIDLCTIAALFYVRAEGIDAESSTPSAPSLVDWYVDAINNNPTNVAAFVQSAQDGSFPSTLRVPTALNDDSTTVAWTVLPGDTVWSIATALALAQNLDQYQDFATWYNAASGVLALNPNWVAGQAASLPSLTSRVFAGDTLDRIRERFPIISPSNLGSRNPAMASFLDIVDEAQILEPLMQITVDGCSYTTTSSETADTLNTIASRYNLSLEYVGELVADVPGLFKVVPGKNFIIPHPPAAPLSSSDDSPNNLVGVVLRDSTSTIAGQVASIVLGGQRFPAPEADNSTPPSYHPTGPIAALFTLTGQQVPSQSPPSQQPSTPTLVTTATFSPTVSMPTWLQFIDSSSAPIESIEFPITDLFLFQQSPGPIIVPAFSNHLLPASLSPTDRLPTEYGFSQRILWDSAAIVSFPVSSDPSTEPPLTGALGIWLFSPTLNSLAATDVSTPYQLFVADSQLGPDAPPTEVSRYAWATIVDVQIATLPGTPGSYQVLGASPVDADLMLAVWQFLYSTTGATAEIHILMQPSIALTTTTLMTSQLVDPTHTFLVQTNLSSVGQSPSAAVRAASRAADALETVESTAPLSDSTNFLRLLWECALVGGQGYWLRYATDSAGGELSPTSEIPATCFAADGTATISLVILVDTQTAKTPDTRRLYPFHNCVVVGDSVDASSSRVFAMSDPPEYTILPATSQGLLSVGATIEGADPDPQTPPNFFSLMALQLTPSVDQCFKGSVVGMASLPQAGADSSTAQFEQVIPSQRFTTYFIAPAVDGLPDPSDDPYAGVQLPSSDGTQANLSQLTVSLTFRDVFGNTSNDDPTQDASMGGPLKINVDVGYTDSLIALGSWPATTTAYTIVGAADDLSLASLSLQSDMQTTAHLPDASQRARAAARKAHEHLRQYSTIYFQQLQPDLTVSLTSTLETTNGALQPLAIQQNTFNSFAASACVWLRTATKQQDLYVAWVDQTSVATAHEIAENYGVSFDQLASANIDVPCSHLFAQPSTPPQRDTEFCVPVFGNFVSGGTVQDLLTKPAYQPDPDLPILLDPQNINLPLRPGIQIAIPEWSFAVRGATDDDTPSLAWIARECKVGVDSIVLANEFSDVLSPGFVFHCAGVEIKVPDSSDPNQTPDPFNLADIALNFQSEHVPFSAVMIAGENADRRGMFKVDAILKIDHRYTEDGDSLARFKERSKIPGGIDPTYIANNNLSTPDLFLSGTAVYVGYDKVGLDADAFAESLADVAFSVAVSPEQLLGFNASVPLLPQIADADHLVIPGQSTFHTGSGALTAAEAAKLPVAYQIQSEPPDTLESIAQKFANADPTNYADKPALALAYLNLNTPKLIAPSVTLPPPYSHHTTPNVAQSIADLANALAIPLTALDPLVAAIGPVNTILTPHAVLLAPLAQVPPSVHSLYDIAPIYGVTVEALALANSTLTGVVSESVTVSCGEADWEIVTSGSGDTLLSLVERFAKKGIATSVAEIAQSSASRGLIKEGAYLLLPPPSGVLMGALGGANEWNFPESIFAIETTLSFSRSTALMDPSFAGTSTQTCSFTVPPIGSNADIAAGALSLLEFATALETNIPPLRLAVDALPTEQADALVAVVFDPQHIASVTLSPAPGADGPTYFALRPLSNAAPSLSNVLIAPLKADGTLDLAVKTNIESADPDAWAWRLLNDIETFLSGSMATAVFDTANGNPDGSTGREQLEQVIAAKETLASAIATGVDYLLDGGQPPNVNDGSDVTAAQEALTNRLLTSLTEGWSNDLVLQYQLSVQSSGAATSSRLAGSIQFTTSSGGDSGGETLSPTFACEKLSLASTGASPGFFHVFVDLPQDAPATTVALPLTLQIQQLECNVQPITGTAYESSNWLSFVQPFEQPTLPPHVDITLSANGDGTTLLPFPSRSRPIQPLVLQHQATPTVLEPTTVEDAIRWTYSISFQAPGISENPQLALSVAVNQPSASDTTDLEVSKGAALFAALAQYNAVAEDLWAILSMLPKYSTPDVLASDKVVIDSAVATFQGLVSVVASAWGSFWASSDAQDAPKVSAPAVFEFTQTNQWDDDDGTLVSIKVASASSAPVIGWPDVNVIYDGTSYPFKQASPTDRSPDTMRYIPGENVRIDGGSLLTYEYAFSSMTIAAEQNASCVLQTRANPDLSDPDVATMTASAAFVMQSAAVSPTDLAAPVIFVPQAIAGEVSLSDVFTTIMEGEPLTFSARLQYQYQLATSPSITPAAPVATFPVAAFHPGTDSSSSVGQFVKAQTNWTNQYRPYAQGAQWLISLVFYSNKKPHDAGALLALTLAMPI